MEECKKWFIFSTCSFKQTEVEVFVGTGLFINDVEIKRKVIKLLNRCIKCNNEYTSNNYGER